MDYDKTEIAATYDKARALAPETVRLWQDLLSVDTDRAAVSLVIDLGCGTGRFSGLLAAHFGVRVIGRPVAEDAGPGSPQACDRKCRLSAGLGRGASASRWLR